MPFVVIALEPIGQGFAGVMRVFFVAMRCVGGSGYQEGDRCLFQFPIDMAFFTRCQWHRLSGN